MRGGPGEARRVSVDPDTAAPVDYGTFFATLTEHLFLRFSLSRNATSFDQDDAAGLSAERSFDYYLLEKHMLLRLLLAYMQPSARPIYPRAWKPRSTCSSGRACQPRAVPAPQRRRKSAGCARKAAPCHACSHDRTLQSESTVPTLRRLRRRLTVCACLPVLPDKQHHCTPVVGPLISDSESTAFKLTVTRTLRQSN